MEKINKIQKLLAWPKNNLELKFASLTDHSTGPTLLDSTFVVPCLLKMEGTRNLLWGGWGGGDGKPMGLSWYKNQALCGFSVDHQVVLMPTTIN